MVLFLIFESASGYALFEHSGSDEVSPQSAELQEAISDSSRFHKIVKLRAFAPFTDAENALENINDLSEGVVSKTLKAFLGTNLPKGSSTYSVGVGHAALGAALNETLGVSARCDAVTQELFRGIRR